MKESANHETNPSGAGYSMVQECSDRYVVTEREDGGAHISIDVPRRFRDLWIVKLSELRTTDAEIKEYEED